MGRCIAITGAGSGLGRSLARRLAHDGDIRVAQPATAHFDEKLAGTWGRLGHILKLRRLLRLEQTIGNHALISLTVSEVPFSLTPTLVCASSLELNAIEGPDLPRTNCFETT